MLEKTYQPADIEARIHAAWMKADAFRAGRPERAGAASYCIVIPPPNVTGSLHTVSYTHLTLPTTPYV